MESATAFGDESRTARSETRGYLEQGKSKQAILAAWGVLSVGVLLGRAIWALAPVSFEAVRSGQLNGWHWWILGSWVLLNAYAEGYRGFYLKFSPRVVRRAFELGRRPSLLKVVLALPYCMGLFQARRRAIVSSWLLLIGITLLVVSVRELEQPWRGIIDAGVVVGLALGLMSLVGLYLRALNQGRG